MTGLCLFGVLVGPAQAQILPPDAKIEPNAATGLREPSDPLEPLNRRIFQVNLLLDDVILKPSAKAYRWAVPKRGRRSVTNFLNNLNTPVVLVNDILQGEVVRAGTTTARFGINSTVGVGGLFDPARKIGLVRHSEDFGQTLGVYGIGGAPYLMAPFLGPTDPRDGIGIVVDAITDPLTWVGGPTASNLKIALFGLKTISRREAIMDQFDEIQRTSIDFYAQTRSIFYQTRNNEIRNGKTDFSDLPDISDLGSQ